MYRDVQINIPMFIGIILLIAIVTSVLVYGVNTFTGLMRKNNDRVNSETQELGNILNIEDYKYGSFVNSMLDEQQNIE